LGWLSIISTAVLILLTPTPARVRPAFQGPVILTGGYLKENGLAAIDVGEADLIGIGKPFVANPDLVERLRNNWPLNAWNSETFYIQGPVGYIDYPPCVVESAA